MGYDFGGYATKIDLVCTDGRVIRDSAFREDDGRRVPLVWGHQHNDPDLVLGHADLEYRPGQGIYANCSFNASPKARSARELVHHGDITAFSIFANRLKQNGRDVIHGVINEVSLVLSGANPGAKIVNAALSHGDGTYEDLDDEATIYNAVNIELPEDIQHGDSEEDDEMAEGTENMEVNLEDELTDELAHADDDGSAERTIGDVLETLNDEQRSVVEYIVGVAAQGNVENEDEEDQNGGNIVKHNAFEDEDYIMHSAVDTAGLFEEVMNDARRNGGSFKDAFLRHAEDYGVALGEDTSTFDNTIMHAAGSASNADGKEPFSYGLANPSIMFPDAHWMTNEPLLINYDQEWVNTVMNGIAKSPFSRIRTHDADIRIEEARARGYVRANEKSEIFYRIAKRETTPTTVYVKTKFNRDDVQDITSFDVVNYTRTQIMRPKLNEELARAILFGDGRPASSEDKINDQCIRPVMNDDEHYTIRTVLTKDVDNVYEMIEEIGGTADQFKGRGKSTFFTTFGIHNKMKWAKDEIGQRIYKGGDSELLGDLNVGAIQEVDNFMDNLTTTYKGREYKVIGIKVTLGDYTVGTDRGGNIFNAEDFDIDFNQYKYLMETRMSGALSRFHSAQVFLVPLANSSSSEPEVEEPTPTYQEATDITVGDDVPANTYYERSGDSEPYTYTLTEDTTFQSGKTYYVVVSE